MEVGDARTVERREMQRIEGSSNMDGANPIGHGFGVLVPGESRDGHVRTEADGRMQVRCQGPFMESHVEKPHYFLPFRRQKEHVAARGEFIRYGRRIGEPEGYFPCRRRHGTKVRQHGIRGDAVEREDEGDMWLDQRVLRIVRLPDGVDPSPVTG